VIEQLLLAERALSMGLVDQAERLYRQAAVADPRNAIAVVGLARVALERADDTRAYREARRALTIDPENVAALRLVARLEEVFTTRGEPIPATDPAVPPPEPPEIADPGAAAPGAPTPVAATPPAPTPPRATTAPSAAATPSPASAAAPSAGGPGAQPGRRPRRGLVDRLLGRGRR
jgi:tetratricopeptide (TPR) repeat protein